MIRDVFRCSESLEADFEEKAVGDSGGGPMGVAELALAKRDVYTLFPSGQRRPRTRLTGAEKADGFWLSKESWADCCRPAFGHTGAGGVGFGRSPRQVCEGVHGPAALAVLVEPWEYRGGSTKGAGSFEPLNRHS